MKLSSLLLLPLLAPVGATLPPGVTWVTPAAGSQWFGCHRIAMVFGVGLCVNSGGFTNQRAKCDHMANVMAQLIDNDGDGVVDDVAVNNEMKSKNYYVFAKELLAEEIGSATAPYPDCEKDVRKETKPLESCIGMSGGSGIYEAIINSCGSPTNRGASSATDRSTWAAAIAPTNGCNPARDATVEEVLHLITEAAAKLYPAMWGGKKGDFSTTGDKSSTAGAATVASNGNCGWGYATSAIKWKDPGGTTCVGYYAYSDDSADEGTLIVEGIYWAIVTYIGGLYTTHIADDIKDEWLMVAPDDGMAALPTGLQNAKSMQSGAPAYYNLVKDTTSAGHLWIPSIFPNGVYTLASPPPPPLATSPPPSPATATPAATSVASSPPPPPSPPNAPPPASYAVKMAVTIAGDVSTFTPEVLTPIRQKVATEAAVPLDAVEATATAGSVKIDFTVNMQSEAAAGTALTAITAKLANNTIASTFLSTPANAVTVQAIVAPTKVVLVSPPPPPAAPPPASPPKKDEAGLPLAAIIGAAAGGAVLLCGVVGLVIFVRSRGGNKAVAPSS